MLCYVFAQAGLLGDLLFFVVGARRAAGSTLFPYTTLFRSEVSEAQSEDIDVAVAAARRAFDEGEWTKMEAAERSHLIYKFADLLEENREELAQLESLDRSEERRVGKECRCGRWR